VPGLLVTAPVGRIAVTIGALPAILPVNFALVGAHIVIRTVPGTKLDAAIRRAIVAFEVDSYAADGSSGWSVLIQGHCPRWLTLPNGQPWQRARRGPGRLATESPTASSAST
jgi:nitroimidazol reductase NimA-like FMN-containing flavoprotein (pyridoxamine 5'-phosphate oxidase superfamily)